MPNHSGGNSVVLGINPHPHPPNKLFAFCGRKAIHALATHNECTIKMTHIAAHLNAE